MPSQRRRDPWKSIFWASPEAVIDGPTQAGRGRLPSPEQEDLKGYNLLGRQGGVGGSTSEHHLVPGPVLKQRMQAGWSWMDALKMRTGRRGHRCGNK